VGQGDRRGGDRGKERRTGGPDWAVHGVDPGGTTTGGGGRDRCVVVKAEAWECRRARDGVGPEARWGGMGSGQPWGGAGGHR
jgi:hypothetical protein